MRIGLFGGTFNPVHFGHLRAAEEVREALGLELVYFIPTASPPHKPATDLAPAGHRLEMVRLATKGNRHFMVADVEMRRGGQSYTVDTVRYFLETLKRPAELFLMVGGDAFAEFESWKGVDEIVRLVNLAVHSRESFSERQPASDLSQVALRLGFEARTNDEWVHPSGRRLSFITTTCLAISATAIRAGIRAKRSMRYLIPADVLDYIQWHSVY